jgi:hypothetical protein
VDADGGMTAGLTGGEYNTQIATDLGKQLNISPMKIDHILFGYTGTLGSYVISAVDAAYRQVAGGEDKRPSKTIFEYPVVKRFFAPKEGSGLRTDAYELYNDVKEVVTTVNALQKAGRVDELEAYLSARQHMLDLKGPVYNIKRSLDRLREDKRAITRTDMDPEVKDRMIEDLDAQMNEHLKVIPRLKELADAPFFQGTF